MFKKTLSILAIFVFVFCLASFAFAQPAAVKASTNQSFVDNFLYGPEGVQKANSGGTIILVLVGTVVVGGGIKYVYRAIFGDGSVERIEAKSEKDAMRKAGRMWSRKRGD